MATLCCLLQHQDISPLLGRLGAEVGGHLMLKLLPEECSEEALVATITVFKP